MPSRQQPDRWAVIAAELGAAVRRLREERELTQEELAHRAGISRNQVQNIEQSRNNARDADGRPQPGPGNPRLDTLYLIADALGVEVADLLPHLPPVPGKARKTITSVSPPGGR